MLQQPFNQRIKIIMGIFMIMLTLIVAQLCILQWYYFDYYHTRAQNNHLKQLAIYPDRGKIYDRNQRLMADNIKENILTIAEDDQQILDFLNANPTENNQIKLSHLQLIKLYGHPTLASKYHPVEQTTRYYPYGKSAFAAVGYGVSHQQQFDAATGIEKQYDELLTGQPGYKQIMVDARGHRKPTEYRIEQQQGLDITLTLDAELQQVAYDALHATKGAVVVMNPNNGEILALVSKPSIDPNQIGQLFNKPHQLGANHPLFNRVVSGLFSPGSTIKPFFGLSGLAHHLITADTVIEDEGFLMYGGHKFHDVNQHGHGRVNLQKAIAVSCDTFFYQLGLKLGIDKMAATLSHFGFGVKTGIDLPNEASGIVPNKVWKMQQQNLPWYGGDTVITAIGQGALISTPIQLAQATSIIANQGFYYTPHLLKAVSEHNDIHPSSHHKHFIAPYEKSHYKQIRDSMLDAMLRGTGRNTFYGAPYYVAGKTGTTQITSHIHTRSQENMPKSLADHSLFIGFSPINKPELVVVVIVENYEMSAIRVAKVIFDQYFKTKREQRVINI